MELGGKKLVVKVDAKTKTVLDEYKGTFSSVVTEFYKQYLTLLQILKTKLFEGKKNMFFNGYSNTLFSLKWAHFTIFYLV